MDGRVGVGIGVVVVLIIAAIAIGMGSKSGTAQSGSLPIFLTDPPQVPAGTTSLMISYSGVQLHVNTAGTGQANPAWVNASGSGTVNLLSIINVSQTIATGSIPNGSTVDMVRFDVSNAKITVNGTVYNVTVPSGMVTAHVGSGSRVNGSTGLLMQMNPTVAAIFTANQTVFVLVPSVKAIFVGSSQQSASVGATRQLNSTELRDLEDAKPNISITAASIGVSGNSTSLSVTVKDNSNQSVVLKHLTIFGNLSAVVNSPAVSNTTSMVMAQLLERLRNQSLCGNASAVASIRIRGGENDSVEVTNESVKAGLAVQDRPDFAANGSAQANISINVSSGESHRNETNASENAGANATVASNESGSHENESSFSSHSFGDFNAHLNSSSCSVAALQAIANRAQSAGEDYGDQVASQQEHFRMLPLLITSGGRLMIASGEDSFDNASIGYNLSSGQSLTLNFTGSLGTAQGHVIVTPQVGKGYIVGVSGEEGASAMANVTATGG